MQLAELRPLLPEAIFDMRYATPHNITNEVLYHNVEPQLQPPAAAALMSAAQYFLHQSLVVVIWDAYRPDEAHQKLRAINSDERYVLKKSNHPLGLAVDLTLATKDGVPLDMGTDFDDFTERAHVNAAELSEVQQHNRLLLAGGMQAAGFVQWPYEWWHFDYDGSTE